MNQHDQRRAYWRANLVTIGWCLAVWALVSLGCGILFAPWLNRFSLGGYPLGFWFAQQGSIYTFIVVIFVYAWRMNRLDHRFGVDEDEHSHGDDNGGASGAGSTDTTTGRGD